MLAPGVCWHWAVSAHLLRHKGTARGQFAMFAGTCSCTNMGWRSHRHPKISNSDAREIFRTGVRKPQHSWQMSYQNWPIQDSKSFRIVFMSLFPSLLPSIFHLFAAACYARNGQHRGLGSHMCLTPQRTVLQMFVLFWWQAILLLFDCRTSESTGVILRLLVLDVIHTFTNRFVMSHDSNLKRLRLLEELKQALGPQWDKCHLSVQHFDVFLTFWTFCFVLKWQMWRFVKTLFANLPWSTIEWIARPSGLCPTLGKTVREAWHRWNSTTMNVLSRCTVERLVCLEFGSFVLRLSGVAYHHAGTETNEIWT